MTWLVLPFSNDLCFDETSIGGVMAGDGASKIYTKGGDKGKTSLVGGARISKANPRLDCYGTIDELNSVVGRVLCEIEADPTIDATDVRPLRALLTHVQNDLFNIGSQLACEDAKMRSQLPTVDDAAVNELEQAMDTYSTLLTPLKNFILPGGTRAASEAHIARTVCRRAERLAVALDETDGAGVDAVLIRFLNRLSDYFFVLSRHLNRLAGVDEPIWAPRK